MNLTNETKKLTKNYNIYQKLSEYNTREYNLLKTAEELQELALVLIQRVNKPTKVDDKEITDEIGDVIIRLRIAKYLFDNRTIQERIKYKVSKFREYIEKKKYKAI